MINLEAAFRYLSDWEFSINSNPRGTFRWLVFLGDEVVSCPGLTDSQRYLYLSWINALKSRCCRRADCGPNALNLARSSLSFAREAEPSAERGGFDVLALALAEYASCEVAAGELDKAEDALFRSLGFYIQADEHHRQGWVFLKLGSLALAQGRIHDSSEYARKALLFLDPEVDPELPLVAANNLACALLDLGDAEAAAEVFQDIHETEVASPHFSVFLRWTKAAILARLGETGPGIQQLRECLAEFLAAEDYRQAGLVGLELARALVSAKDFSAARETFETALGLIHSEGASPRALAEWQKVAALLVSGEAAVCLQALVDLRAIPLEFAAQAAGSN